MIPVIIIAEAGVNHNGDLSLASKLIQSAAEAGADFVKFQTFKAESLVSAVARKAEYQMSGDDDQYQYKMLKDLELSYDDHQSLISECKKNGIGFLSSAFDLASLDFLNTLKLRYLKIPSGELTNLPYLRKAGRSGMHILLSTGMCTTAEIHAAVDVLIQSGSSRDAITLLHCNTSYPTPFSDVNLLAIPAMQQEFKLPVGYSDHTNGIEAAIGATALGACVIEKHFTIDKNLAGPDHKASLEPHELMQMVKAIRNVEAALGSSEKKPTSSELKNINIARKSIHLAKSVNAGHVLTEADFIMKRPGDGISPMEMDNVIGKVVKRNLQPDYKLRYDDLD